MSPTAISDGTTWGFYGTPGVLTPPEPPPPPWFTLLDVNFGSQAAGAMTQAKIRALLNDPTMPTNAVGLAMMSLVTPEGEDEQVCRIDFTAGKGNSSDPAKNEGIIFFADLDHSGYPGGRAAAKDRMYRVTLEVMVQAGWDFATGMKYPGLGAAIGVSDGQASGGNGGQAGMSKAFSARRMIHKYKAGVTGFFAILGGLLNLGSSYKYFPGMTAIKPDGNGIEGWFDDPGDGNGTYPDGEWFETVDLIKMNTLGDEDGIDVRYVDGVELFRERRPDTTDGATWRTDAEVGPTHFWWHWFFGGSSTATPNPWGPSQDQYLLVRTVRVEVALEDEDPV